MNRRKLTGLLLFSMIGLSSIEVPLVDASGERPGSGESGWVAATRLAMPVAGDIHPAEDRSPSDGCRPDLRPPLV